MIPNQWYVILESKQLKQKPSRCVETGREDGCLA